MDNRVAKYLLESTPEAVRNRTEIRLRTLKNAPSSFVPVSDDELDQVVGGAVEREGRKVELCAVV